MRKCKCEIGEISYNNQNLQMKVIGYRNSMDIDIQFEDGTVVKNRTYDSFKKGAIKNKNQIYHNNTYNKNKESRIGEQKHNKKGFLMEIIEYKGSENIIVQFNDNDKTQVKTRYNLFRNGDVKYPYEKTLLGVASVGNTNIWENGKHKKSYKVWSSMITRCYSKKYHKRQPTYKDCEVCKEWLCFENFEKWFNQNYYEIKNERVCLDKDILVKNNKIYSPNTCCFVPQAINNYYKCNNNYNKEYIGIRKRHIQDLAIKYKNYINKKVYNILYNEDIDENK